MAYETIEEHGWTYHAVPRRGYAKQTGNCPRQD
jgi:hypothetical protein